MLLDYESASNGRPCSPALRYVVRIMYYSSELMNDDNLQRRPIVQHSRQTMTSGVASWNIYTCLCLVYWGWNRQTDGRTDGQSQAKTPPALTAVTLKHCNIIVLIKTFPQAVCKACSQKHIQADWRTHGQPRNRMPSADNHCQRHKNTNYIQKRY